MDAVVQLFRNALCCVKDLKLFSGSFLYDSTLISTVYSFPAPVNKTTPLELCICILQLYACISCIKTGIRMMTVRGTSKLKRIERVASVRKPSSKLPHELLINKSLNIEAVAAGRDMGVGYCILIIGIAFFWLFANSLHVTETEWIGGLSCLIHALTAMELSLIPLLYLMLKDGLDSLRKSALAWKLSRNLSTSNSFGENFTLDIFCMIEEAKGSPWKPFWADCDGPLSEVAEAQMLAKEVEKVESSLKSLLSDESKDTKLKADLSLALAVQSKTLKFSGYRDFCYFLLNFIAFYGYLIGILVYYFDDEEKQPFYVASMRFGYSNSQADWMGNFAGDLMWTLEPIIILVSPFVITFIGGSRRAKAKAD